MHSIKMRIHEKEDQHLKVQTLGRFRIANKSETVQRNNIYSHKAWELLQFFFSNRGKVLTNDYIIDNLWPDSDYAHPRATLRMQIYRMRKLLETTLPDWTDYFSISSFKGSYRLDISDNLWLDIEEFKNLYLKASQLYDNHPAEAVKLYRKAVSLYKGEYLPEITSSLWVLPLRNYYRNLYLKSVLDLIILLRDANRFSEIIDICEETFLIEPFEEELHVQYLNALLKEEKIQKARTHYEHITSMMYEEVGAKPSSALKDIYRIIKADSEAVEFDVSYIQQMLKCHEDVSGAYFCSPEVFRSIYGLERRQAERTGQPAVVGLLTLTSSGYSLPPANLLKQEMKILESTIKNSLRKGDIVGRWNEAQFILLLPSLQEEDAEKVFQRIKNGYYKKRLHKEIRLRSTSQALFPRNKE